jgi:organic hydroperoxide reductase OsmC/OhrA
VDLLAGDHGTAVLTADGRASIRGGPPPEFGGDPGQWSPEHLFLSSVALCLMTTYQAFTARAGVPVARYESHVEGTLDKTRDGLAFTDIVVRVDLQVDEDAAERAGQLLETARKHCIVSNALKPAVRVEAQIRRIVPA